MTRHAHLNNVEHRDLRIITARGAQYGDEVMYTLTFPAEFRNIQAHYPIVFGKASDGTFTPLALFGFREKQNLFLKDGKWDAQYIPLMIERNPFLIGNAPNGKVVHIDLESPRVSRTEGEAIFASTAATPNTSTTSRACSARCTMHRVDTGVHQRAGRTQPAGIFRARHEVQRWRAASLRRLLHHPGRAARQARHRGARQAARAGLPACTW
jgi:hypothetical protein